MTRPKHGGRALVALLMAAAPDARAHGFDERYDLPVPLAWVVVGACAVVSLSFVAAAALARGGAAAGRRGLEVPMPRGAALALRALGFALFALALAAALWGTRDPLANLAPTLVWIVAWLGMAFASALAGGVWTLLDPWRSAFDAIDAAARRLGRPHGASLGWRWPDCVGQWPAVALLLLWCWLEVVDPLAATPERLGGAMALWSVVNVAGMSAFGAPAWQARADVFAIFFATLARLAPLRLQGTPALEHPPSRGQVAFVLAMLATVVFDGLHGGSAWLVFEGALRHAIPRWLDVNGRVAGTLGLVGTWAAFGLAYGAVEALSRRLLRPARLDAATLALTLVPIALGYHVAHNFSSLLIQGQRFFALLSDPFGRQWDLFGTARWYPDIGIVDARTTWFVALIAIVGGHVSSIWASHRTALAAGALPRRAARAMLPMMLLMIGFTAVSLMLIAEPMVASAG